MTLRVTSQPAGKPKLLDLLRVRHDAAGRQHARDLVGSSALTATSS